MKINWNQAAPNLAERKEFQGAEENDFYRQKGSEYPIIWGVGDTLNIIGC